MYMLIVTGPEKFEIIRRDNRQEIYALMCSSEFAAKMISEGYTEWEMKGV
jgi:hypothetical protein